MQNPIAYALLALALASPALAEDIPPQPLLATCPLTGGTVTRADCTAPQESFDTGMTDCLQTMQSKASANTGMVYKHNSHTYRAQSVICDREVRARMGLSD